MNNYLEKEIKTNNFKCHLFLTEPPKNNDEFIALLARNNDVVSSLKSLFNKISAIASEEAINKINENQINIGAAAILRGVIGILQNCNNVDEYKANFNNFLYSVGVEKIVTKDNKLNISPDSCQRVIDLYNDPEDPNIITSVTPGYILKTETGNIVLQYEDVKINEAHYNNPLELLIKNENKE